jgi:outer membrane protein assembly factor BamA
MEVRILRSARVVVCLVLGLGACNLASAQTANLAAIHIVGSQRYPEATIIEVTGLKVGQQVSRDDLQAAANRLAEVGLFKSVKYRFSSSGDNMSLEFQVEDASTVPVSFDNFPWFTDAELTEAIKQTMVLFDGTAPEQGEILDTMAQTLTKLLATRSVHATAEHTLLAAPAGGLMQQFKAVGASLKVNAVQFGDALATNSKRVKDRLPDLVGKPYSRQSIEIFLNEQVRPVYLEQGHLRVQFGQPSARFTGDPNRPLADKVLVIVPMEAGPVYRWGGVTWNGNGAFGPAPLDEIVAFKPGDLADGMKIAAAWQRVEKEYSRRGFLEMKLDPQPVFDDAKHEVKYRATLDEGVQYRMGEMVITGLSPVAERKLIEGWRLPRGQIFDGVYFEEFLAKGIKEAFGDYPVHFDEVGHWLRTNAETRTVDVLLDFH